MTEISQTISTLSNPIVRKNMTSEQIAVAGDTTISELQTIFGQQNTLSGQINTVAGEVNSNAAAAAQSVTDAADLVALAVDQVDLATDQAALATAAKTAAENASNATAYDTDKVDGYTAGTDYVYSPSTYLAFQCIQTQAQGSVQPLTDTTYWRPLGAGSSAMSPTYVYLAATL